MWMSDDRILLPYTNSRRDSTNGTSNHLSNSPEVEKNLSSSNGSDEVALEHFKINEIGQIYRNKFEKTDDIIRSAISKWQIYNNIKYLHENAVNAILDSIFVSVCSTQEHSLNSRSNNFVLENEAVLMAIEWKGLKQHNSTCNCYCQVQSTENNQCYSLDNDIDSNNTSRNYSDTSKLYGYPSVQRKYIIEKYNVDNSTTNNEIQENNFETNFMVEAVSAAIEVKGLTYKCRERYF